MRCIFEESDVKGGACFLGDGSPKFVHMIVAAPLGKDAFMMVQFYTGTALLDWCPRAAMVIFMNEGRYTPIERERLSPSWPPLIK